MRNPSRAEFGQVSGERPLRWVASAKRDLLAMPEEVRDVMGYALDQVQRGLTPLQAKVMHGLGSGVWEIVDNHEGDTYRAVYVVRFEDAVYALHVFQKKSHRGGELPKPDRELIAGRLKEIEQEHRKA